MTPDETNKQTGGVRPFDIAVIALAAAAGGVFGVWVLIEWHFGTPLYDTAGIAILLGAPFACASGIAMGALVSYVTLTRVQLPVRGVVRSAFALASCLIFYAVLIRTGFAETLLRPRAAEERRQADFDGGLVRLRAKPWITFYGSPAGLHVTNTSSNAATFKSTTGVPIMRPVPTRSRETGSSWSAAPRSRSVN